MPIRYTFMFQEARKAYEHVFVIRPLRPVSQQFYQFEDDVKRLAKSEYNYTWKDDSEVS